jgi:hypothetical protein
MFCDTASLRRLQTCLVLGILIQATAAFALDKPIVLIGDQPTVVNFADLTVRKIGNLSDQRRKDLPAKLELSSKTLTVNFGDHSFSQPDGSQIKPMDYHVSGLQPN